MCTCEVIVWKGVSDLFFCVQEMMRAHLMKGSHRDILLKPHLYIPFGSSILCLCVPDSSLPATCGGSPPKSKSVKSGLNKAHHVNYTNHCKLGKRTINWKSGFQRIVTNAGRVKTKQGHIVRLYGLETRAQKEQKRDFFSELTKTNPILEKKLN